MRIVKDYLRPHRFLPDADVSPLSHVAGKRQSNWISTTKDLNTAMEKYNSGNGVVKIDLDKVDSEIMDVSNGIPKGGRFSNYAKRDREVLINKFIPQSAIDIIE